MTSGRTGLIPSATTNGGDPMSDVTELVERYLATWNETDPQARRAEIDKTWAADASHVEPLVAAEGRDASDEPIAGAQMRFAGLRFRLAGTVDAHHNLARFTWELAPEGAEAIVEGFDVAVLTDA